MGLSVVNILDMKEAIGENSLNELLSDFTCTINPEIEDFVKNNALNFSKSKLSVTYLVIDDDSKLVAVFALAHKAIKFVTEGISPTFYKKAKRYISVLDDTSYVSAFLIAQFGKNMKYKTEIDGNALMDHVFSVLTEIQHSIGGGIVYLECEEKEKLLNFYMSPKNNFKILGERISDDGVKYILLCNVF